MGVAYPKLLKPDGRRMAAQQLMKKGKREVAAIIKSQCSTVMGHTQLNCILDQLLDPQKTIEDHDRIDWCRMIVAGGLSFEDFAETGTYFIII